MGMIYKGVAYEYAFTLNVPTKNRQARKFNVVISDFREESQDFSGLCLENEIRAISEKRWQSEAFYEIVDTIAKATFDGERAFTRLYPGEDVSPFMSVTDPDFLRKFEKYKQSRKSLEYYSELRKHFEEHEFFEEPEYIQTIAV